MKPDYKWLSKQNDTLIKEYLKDPHSRPPREIEKYLNGFCDHFAIAASYYFNLKLGVILEPRPIIEGNEIIHKPGIVHAFCFINSKTIFDAKGIRPLNSVLFEYIMHPDYWITNVKLIDLYYKSYTRFSPYTKRLLKRDVKEAIEMIKTYYEKDFNRYKFLRNNLP